jgi:2-O-A-mannosyl-D-glycerate-specific PTS system IIC component
MSEAARLLDPRRVCLDAAADSRDGAVEAAVSLLREDPRIESWDAFRPWIGPKQVMDLEGSGGGVILAHGRSAAVKDMALSALRWNSPAGPRFVFVFAIPSAMTEQYLRKVGALARVCRDEKKLAALASAATPEAFADALEEWIA